LWQPPGATNEHGRIRTTSPNVFYEASFKVDKNVTVFSELVVGTGTSAHVSPDLYVKMEVPTNGDRGVRQTGGGNGMNCIK
jgi:hypothetical protein